MGKTDYTVYTPELLKEEKQIEPYQVVDIKSLMGDSSDNIPGVKGIGEKTAYNLIYKYTTLDNIYKNIDTLDASAKIIEKLKNDEEMARLSYTLATINRNVPIDLNYEENKVCEVNKEEVYKLFKRLSFNKFLAKYDFDNLDIENDELAESKISMDIKNIIVIDNSNYSSYYSILDDLFKNKELAYILNINDTNQAFNNILSINDRNFLSFYSEKDDKCYILNFDLLKDKKEYIKSTLTKFANSSCEKLGYNIKQDIRFIFTNICDNINNFKYDLLIACYLLDSTRNYKFEGILEELFNINLNIKNDAKKQVQLSLFDNQQDLEKIDNELLLDIALATKGIFNSRKIIEKKLNDDSIQTIYGIGYKIG